MEKSLRLSVEPEPFSYPPIDEQILDLLREGRKFIVVGHVSPDGDCLSSQFAVGALLEHLGKEVTLANAGPFTRSEISHLSHHFVKHIDEELKSQNPLVVVVDCSSPERLGHLAEEIEGLETIIFDHHSSGEQFGTWRYIVSRSISTTMIIMHLYQSMGIEISQEVAEHLFFGFATDSGFFRFINAYRGETLRMVADLVDKGVSPNAMADRMNGGKNEGYVKYLGKLIDRSESHYEGKLMTVSALLEDERLYTTNDKPSDALYGLLLGIEGVEMVLFFKELEDSKTEVGFRSAYKSTINVGQFAESLGGGGHRKASGATIDAPLDEARKIVIAAAGKLLA